MYPTLILLNSQFKQSLSGYTFTALPQDRHLSFRSLATHGPNYNFSAKKNPF